MYPRPEPFDGWPEFNAALEKCPICGRNTKEERMKGVYPNMRCGICQRSWELIEYPALRKSRSILTNSPSSDNMKKGGDDDKQENINGTESATLSPSMPDGMPEGESNHSYADSIGASLSTNPTTTPDPNPTPDEWDLIY